MSHRVVFRFVSLTAGVWLMLAGAAAAQEHQHAPAPAPAPQDEHAGHAQPPAQDEQAQHAGHDMAATTLFSPREGSGTAWLPQDSPMYGLHRRAGAWELMGHGNAFLQYLHENAEEHRGSDEAGSINWLMVMARRPLAGGRVGLRGMFSLEPWSIRGCGYPDLLATGETCEGDNIHDEQHPHDLFMEAAAEYQRPIRPSLSWHLYAGLAGEPALGPVAYPHRISAMPNPVAPIGHHWLDATHITFGVLTTGLSGERWRAEGSLFNGREPDERRWDFDFAALDSYSGRVTFAPARSLALQVSAGHLKEAEPGHDATEPRVDVDRVTASAMYHRTFGGGGVWATTAAWGRNLEQGEATHAALLETSLTLDGRHTWFGRGEIGGKAAHDLDVHESEDVFTVGKLQVGYVRYLAPARGFQLGVGGAVAGSFLPEALAPRYGGRVRPGFAVFLNLRPAAHSM